MCYKAEIVLTYLPKPELLEEDFGASEQCTVVDTVATRNILPVIPDYRDPP